MNIRKKTLVILAFHQTKIPKKKLKKVLREITSYLMVQNFNDFLILKQEKQSTFLRFDENQKKTYAQMNDIKERNYSSYLYLNCSSSFFCGDYNSFCLEESNKVQIGLIYDERKAQKQEILESENLSSNFPFSKEKVLFFTKESLKNIKTEKKESKFLFGKKTNTHSNTSLQTIKGFYEQRRPCLFLDRDGIIIKDKGYLSQVKDIEFVDGIFNLVKWANENNWYVIILTNQSGIGSGLYSEEQYKTCETYIEEEFRKRKLLITKTYFSPYHQDSLDKGILKEIYTRKPFPGMLLKASKDFPIDLESSLMLGDKKTDKLIEAPLKTYFVKGAYPLEESNRSFTCLKDVLKELKSEASAPI